MHLDLLLTRLLQGKRDYDKAFNLFLLAGKHGHSDACYRAAQCCENGWGCKRDSGKAVTLYRCVAQGLPGKLFGSLKLTRFFCRRAAVLNHPGAMHRLALAELNAELGLSRRPREGVRWLKRAAELADQVDPPQPQSLHELAMLHEKGIENVIFQVSACSTPVKVGAELTANICRTRNTPLSCWRGRLSCSTLLARTSLANATSTARWAALRIRRSASTTTVSLKRLAR